MRRRSVAPYHREHIGAYGEAVRFRSVGRIVFFCSVLDVIVRRIACIIVTICECEIIVAGVNRTHKVDCVGTIGISVCYASSFYIDIAIFDQIKAILFISYVCIGVNLYSCNKLRIECKQYGTQRILVSFLVDNTAYRPRSGVCVAVIRDLIFTVVRLQAHGTRYSQCFSLNFNIFFGTTQTIILCGFFVCQRNAQRVFLCVCKLHRKEQFVGGLINVFSIEVHIVSAQRLAFTRANQCNAYAVA